MAQNAPKTVYLADYQAPDYVVEKTALNFILDPKRTIVRSNLSVKRANNTEAGTALVLNGEALELLSVKIDGVIVSKDAMTLGETTLTIKNVPDDFKLEIETACSPQANTALSGLYLSNEMFCTQCEAQGFRRITYFPDRPDVLSIFSVRIEADKGAYPVLLANGNLTNQGDLDDGRHFTEWHDPHPKPSYLFALVGGDLACVQDQFTTCSGRDVALKIFVQPENKDKCAYTLDALKRSMRWDEETFGREYDLDIFMIVAVDHFNFGAMENKGLNIFNSAYVLASPETATDMDYETIESIVAHEYFHNWSGNRVTCRDWFQLCLKEGFTVFRDQEFSADMRSRPVQRIKDVRRLWAHQFPEDRGPLAHPPRPDQYMTIDNFYTATVYEKGAELARMLKSLLGPEKFRAASDLYFDRHDGTAATVEDFIAAMEDASGKDLKQFRRWYSDAGAPNLTVTPIESDKQGEARFKLHQKTAPTPGQKEKPPRHIPVAYAAYDPETGAQLDHGLFEMREEEQTLTVKGDAPVLSLLGGFSAPVTLSHNQSLEQKLLLIAHDQDPFNRWAAVNGLWQDLCLGLAGAIDLPAPDTALEKFCTALGDALKDAQNDPAFAAELLKAPTPAELAQEAAIIDPAAIVKARKHVRGTVAQALKEPLRTLYDSLRSNAPYAPEAAQAAPRALKNAALGLLTITGEAALADSQASSAANMTDEAAAVAALAGLDHSLRTTALERFYQKWRTNTLVVNKWLAWRALTPAADALQDVKTLTKHEAYDAGVPNKVRALIGVFARENIEAFHALDGGGYDFFVEQILAIDPKNPQLSARLVGVLESWRKLEPTRRALAQDALKRIAGHKGLSTNLYEMAERLL